MIVEMDTQIKNYLMAIHEQDYRRYGFTREWMSIG